MPLSGGRFLLLCLNKRHDNWYDGRQELDQTKENVEGALVKPFQLSLRDGSNVTHRVCFLALASSSGPRSVFSLVVGPAPLHPPYTLIPLSASQSKYAQRQIIFRGKAPLFETHGGQQECTAAPQAVKLASPSDEAYAGGCFELMSHVMMGASALSKESTSEMMPDTSSVDCAFVSGFRCFIRAILLGLRPFFGPRYSQH